MGEGIESHVVDPASIAAPRRRRRAKTDRLDGEALLRALMAFKRGEPRVCAMAVPPSREEEDNRRLGRERKTLLVERVRHVNGIKGLLFSQGISDFEPLNKDRRQRLEELQTGDGHPLPHHLKVAVGRELDRLELLLGQIKAVESERDEMLDVKKKKVRKTDERKSDERKSEEPAGAPPSACARCCTTSRVLGRSSPSLYGTRGYFGVQQPPPTCLIRRAGSLSVAKRIDRSEQGVSKAGTHAFGAR